MSQQWRAALLGALALGGWGWWEARRECVSQSVVRYWPGPRLDSDSPATRWPLRDLTAAKLKEVARRLQLYPGMDDGGALAAGSLRAVNQIQDDQVISRLAFAHPDPVKAQKALMEIMSLLIDDNITERGQLVQAGKLHPSPPWDDRISPPLIDIIAPPSSPRLTVHQRHHPWSALLLAMVGGLLGGLASRVLGNR